MCDLSDFSNAYNTEDRSKLREIMINSSVRWERKL